MHSCTHIYTQFFIASILEYHNLGSSDLKITNSVTHISNNELHLSCDREITYLVNCTPETMNFISHDLEVTKKQNFCKMKGTNGLLKLSQLV